MALDPDHPPIWLRKLHVTAQQLVPSEYAASPEEGMLRVCRLSDAQLELMKAFARARERHSTGRPSSQPSLPPAPPGKSDPMSPGNDRSPGYLAVLSAATEALAIASSSYCVIGALALGAWGRPRATHDLGLLVMTESSAPEPYLAPLTYVLRAAAPPPRT